MRRQNGPRYTELGGRRYPGGREIVKLFDALDGIPARNVLGLGDPDVHRIGDRWVMFLGGFTTRFRNTLFRATLPRGAPLSSTAWTLPPPPGEPDRAAPLVRQPPRGSWDHYGLHTPSYAVGVDPLRGRCERIYYSGRSTWRSTGSRSRYGIGVLERAETGWVRRPEPVLTGPSDRPSVLEPVVVHDGGLWRMWYLSTPHEAGRGDLPDHRLEYVESEDGLTGWSAPRIVFSDADSIFDNAVLGADGHYEMVIARGHNLYGSPGFPPQGLWWAESDRPSGTRSDWSSDPVCILDVVEDRLPWFANGAFGPALAYDEATDPDVAYVFFTGVHRRVSWFRRAAARLRSLRKPPVPAPFYFAVGRLSLSPPPSPFA